MVSRWLRRPWVAWLWLSRLQHYNTTLLSTISKAYLQLPLSFTRDIHYQDLSLSRRSAGTVQREVSLAHCKLVSAFPVSTSNRVDFSDDVNKFFISFSCLWLWEFAAYIYLYSVPTSMEPALHPLNREKKTHPIWHTVYGDNTLFLYEIKGL